MIKRNSKGQFVKGLRGKNLVKKKCLNCGKSFETYPSHNCKYCSRQCCYNSLEWRKKISKNHKGLNIWSKGRKQSKEWIEKRIKANTGHNHYRWNPNRGEVERNERNDGGYKQWILKVKKRDKNVCRLKNKNCSGYNIVHHIRNWSNYPELRYKVNNGITLCQAHHPRTRAKEKRLIPIFQGLVSVSS